MTLNKSVDPTLRALSAEQSAFYHENGWLLTDDVIPNCWLERLRDAAVEIVDRTRSMKESSTAIELFSNHSAEHPSLFNVASPCDMHPAIWEFVSNSPLVDMVCDLLGSPVSFRYSQLRFKKLGPCDVWHQDMPFDSLDGEGVMAGIHLHETGPKQPRLQVISGSHRGETFTHLDKSGEFIGRLNEEEMRRVDANAAVDLVAPAGSIEFLDYRTLHQDFYGGEQEGGVLLYAAYAADGVVPIGESRYPSVPSQRKGTLLRA